MTPETETENAVMTQEEAIHWIAGILQEPPDRLTPDTQREEVNAWDSMGVLMLMAGMDEQFKIVLSDTDMKSMRKVDDILAVLRKHNKLVGAS